MPLDEPPPIIQSVLPNLFATTSGVTAELRADYSDVDGLDATIISALAHVQYLTPRGVGGYLRVPFGYLENIDDSDLDIGGSSIGNIELGGLYVARIGATDVLARAGVAIDTADDTLPLALSTVLPRTPDVYATGSSTTWARGQVQLRHAVDSLRLGAAVGADVPVAGDATDGFTAVLAGIAAAGFEQGPFGLGVSFSFVQPITDEDEDSTKALHLSADWAIDPSVRLCAQLGFVLEDNADGIAIGVGSRATF